MRINRHLAALLLCLACSGVAAAQAGSAAAAPQKPKDELGQPSDLVKDFPAFKWGMSFQDAKKTVEQTGARATHFKSSEAEMAWESSYEGMRGRGALFFREGQGLSQIAVGLYAFDKRAALYDGWLKKLTARHGEPTENHDDEFALTKVWRLKTGFAIQLRTLKDAHSPVVEITWVRE